MNMNMKKTLFAILTAAAAGSATVVHDNQELLASKIDSIEAKRGFEIGGSIRANAQASYFDTKMDPSGSNKMPETERNEFVYADIDFRFRPYESVRANAMIRLGGGMQDYFAAATKTVSVAWINVEGNIGKSFYWIVGDFRQQYSPLTLFTPGIDIMYEPTVFARKRHMAEKQQMIEGNQRNLQGANIQFRQELNPMLGEVRAEALLARLNRTAVLDFSGAEGNIMANGGYGSTLASNTDKWLGAGNIELLPLSKNLYVGVTPMYIFDDKDSYSYVYRHEYNNLQNPYVLEPINSKLDSAEAQKTIVVSGRLGADVAGIIKSNNIVLDLVGEVAVSKDKVYSHDTYPLMDEEGNPVLDPNDNPVEGDRISSKKLTGMAILGTVNAGYKTDSWSAIVKADVIANDSSWFNNAAQSPSFFAQRILNSDKDGNTVRYGINSPLYSTFDALYNYSPKFSPVTKTLGTDDNGFSGGQTESYNIANYNKNSWGTNVYTHAQLALLESMMDQTIQMALPNGLATSNRVGTQAVGTINLGDAFEMQGLFGMFSQKSAVSTGFFDFDEAEYKDLGGGAKWDIFKTFGISNRPFEISGSYKHSTKSMGVHAEGYDGTAKIASEFYNGGLYIQYLPRLGLTFGAQVVETVYSSTQGALSGLMAPLMKSRQKQWMAGLDYTVATNAWLAVNYGMISVENRYNTSELVGIKKSSGEADAKSAAATAYNLPTYYDVTKDNSGTYRHKFTQSILEASINVEF